MHERKFVIRAALGQLASFKYGYAINYLPRTCLVKVESEASVSTNRNIKRLV